MTLEQPLTARRDPTKSSLHRWKKINTRRVSVNALTGRRSAAVVLTSKVIAGVEVVCKRTAVSGEDW
jgi:hypothetical protein